MQVNLNTQVQKKTNYTKLLIGLICVVIYIGLSNMPTPQGLTPNGQKALALMIVAVISWIFEVIPIGISAALFAMLMGILGIIPQKDAMASFMIPTVFFIMSAFIIARGFIDTGLGNRISLYVSTLFGTKAEKVLLSFMLPTAIISTVLADIPTAVIFSSMAYTLLKKNDCTPGKSNFGRSVMMGIPIAAAIGGIGTPAGSGLNVLALSLLKSSANVEINFLQWTLIGFPMSIILTLVSWYIIKKMVPSEFENVKGLDDVKKELKNLGGLTLGEKKFIAIFSVTLILWVTQPWNKIDTAVVAIVTATLFFLPGIELCTWEKAKSTVSWDVLLLVGASSSLASALTATKAAPWLANTFLGGLTGLGIVMLLLIVSAFGVFSHLIIPVGNAVLAVAIPVIAVVAAKVGVNPGILTIPIAFTASCVFLIPLDPIPLTTYNYGYWKFSDMAKPGVIISLIWIVLNIIFMYGAQLLGII